MARSISTRIKHHEPSWRIASSHVEAFVSVAGGHLAPVTFDRGGRRIRPYHIAPWSGEEHTPALPPILRVLRGDFFCMPFGGNDTPYRGERHPIHGETSNKQWAFHCRQRSAGRTTLHLRMQTRTRKATVDKYVSVIDGHNAVYCRDVIGGMSGLMSYGHHAMLRFNDKGAPGNISTSPFICGRVSPKPLEQPADRGYSILQPDAEFNSLSRVPTSDGQTTDLSSYPARQGYEDIAMIASRPGVKVAWTAATFPEQRYVWFALKDPKVLPCTLMWSSNGGRHYPPWNGRHVGVLGLEEVMSYFHYGLSQSARKNPFNASGIPTVVRLKPSHPHVVNYITAIATVPRGFKRVKQISTHKDGVQLLSSTDHRIDVPLDTAFLHQGP
jgi:hypothetical protein